MESDEAATGPILGDTPYNPIPAGAEGGYFSAPDGTRLRYGLFPTSRSPCRGTVLILAGRLSFIEKYYEAIGTFTGLGYHVAMPDLRGQGGSQRGLDHPQKHFVRSFDDYVKDLAAFMDGIDGFPQFVPDVRQQAADANRWSPVLYGAASLLYGLAVLLALLMPFILLGVYLRYGREKPFTVPEYLSFTPNTALKPWQVNLLFKGDALEFDDNGFYATVLDLHRQGKIVVTEKPEGGGVTVRIVSGESTDPYEQRVLNFLANVADDHVVDTAELAAFAETARRSPGYQHRILQYQQSLAALTKSVDTTLSRQYIRDGRELVLPLLFLGAIPCGLAILAFILAPWAAYLLIPAGVLSFIVAVQVGIAALFPSTLFGIWKDDHYKEKLEWDAFAYFLSDLALIRQYSPADLSMWGEWLVYGTALGLGDKVEQAMKNLNISLPDVGMPLYSNMPVIFAPIVFYSPPSSGGGHGGFGGGGSFGGGGGFGGGGVGGR